MGMLPAKRVYLQSGASREPGHAVRKRYSHEKEPSFRHYGAKGIKDRFPDFYEWALRSGYRKGRHLVRADEDGDFSPANCSWRRRRARKIARAPVPGARFSAFGERKTVPEWAADPRCVVSKWALRERLIRGVAPETALTSPASPGTSLPSIKKPVIARRPYAKTDWARARRLRARGMT